MKFTEEKLEKVETNAKELKELLLSKLAKVGD
jgi:hypothetical protein